MVGWHYDDIIARTCVALELNDLRVHINNNTVEEFYRTGDFSEWTIDRVKRSALSLLTQIGQCDTRVRFNKGSLFTWLRSGPSSRESATAESENSIIERAIGIESPASPGMFRLRRRR
jgi:hypothetical protein